MLFTQIGYDNVPSWPEYKDILRKRIDEIVSIYIEKDTWGQKVVAPNGSMFPMQEGVALPDERESTRLQLLSTLDAHMYPTWTLKDETRLRSTSTHPSTVEGCVDVREERIG